MNIKIRTLIFVLIIGLTNISFSQESAKLDIINIKSEFLNQERRVLVYTPWLYEERDLVAFDVIYVFDAQHRELFDLVHSASSFIMGDKKFIVVGIQSSSYPEMEYYRNNDLYPKPINVKLENYNVQNPNSENFWQYVSKEVIPLISKKYRTTNNRYFIGHSLSASFVLDKVIKQPELIDGVISISPNLAYDENRLAQDFISGKFADFNNKKFIYISQANEINSFGEKWVNAYEKVKSFVESKDSLENTAIFLKEFPDQNHWNVFLPSLTLALNNLKGFIDKNGYVPKGDLREVTFKVLVLDENDQAFITGNQESLGNWNASKVEMKKISPLEREIKLKVQFPLEFKITRGDWSSQAFTNQTTNSGENIVIFDYREEIKLKVEQWSDR